MINLGILKHAFEEAPFPMMVTDINGVQLKLNKSLESLLQVSEEKLVGRRFQEYTHPEDQEHEEALYRSLLRNEICSYILDKRIIDNVGHLHWVKVFVSVGDHDIAGNPNWCLTIVEDITARRRDQVELQINQQELQRVNNEMETYLNVASHDLQSPLRAIMGFIVLLKETLESPNPLQLDYIGEIERGCERLKSLISGILTYSTLRKVEEDWKEIPLNSLLDNILSQYDGKSYDLEVDKSLGILWMSETKAYQLFQNLIDNAFKFCDKRLVLKIFRTKNIISVQDNGIGIDLKYKDLIFCMFQRLNSRAKYSGSGIGLAICKRIMDSLGGKISFTSKLNEGTCFNLEFPRACIKT